MSCRFGYRVGASTLALALGVILTAPVAGYAQTQGTERRDDRQDARDTKQAGRDAARDAKQECKDAGGKVIDCAQQKGDVRKDARQDAKDIKKEQ